MNRKWATSSVAVVLAAAACFVWGGSYDAYWVDGYRVAVHLKRSGDYCVVGIIARPLHAETFQSATRVLGSAPASSPRYFDLFEMRGVRPEPVKDEAAPITVGVDRHGKDETFPRRKRVHERRQEKLALGVYFSDGSRNCFIFDIPAPDEPPDITAQVSAGLGEPTDAADVR